MKERQLIELNRMAMRLGSLTIFCGLGLCVYEILSLGAQPMLYARGAIDVVLMVVFLLAFYRLKDKQIFMYVGSAILIVAYVFQVFCTSYPFMYSFMYPVALYVMMYMNTRFTIIAGSLCACFNVVICIVNTVKDANTLKENVGQLMFSFVGCIMAIVIVSIQNRHHDEQMAEIDKNIENAERVNKEIMGLSNTLAEKFAVAEEHANSVTESMKVSNSSTQEISQSIRTTAEAIEQQTAQTANIQESIIAANEETENMQQSSDDSVAAVEQGIRLMEELGKQAELTGRLNRESGETTDKLNERIKSVEDIIGEILAISSKTNLLALNASIEAARAGEAGRGFAVVADEIRQLSEQTRQSANRITDIIKQLVGDAGEASDNMKKSIEASDQQNKMITETVEQIGVIKDKNDDLHKAMENLRGMMSDIMDSNHTINDSISNLSAMSEEVYANSTSSVEMVGKSLDAMEDLDSLLNQINDIAEKLKAVK